MVLLTETAPTTPTRTPPSLSLAPDDRAARPPTRSFSAPGLPITPLATTKGQTVDAKEAAGLDDYRTHIGSASTCVPTIAVIEAASRRPGHASELLAAKKSGKLRGSKSSAELRAASMDRLITPLYREKARANAPWPPNYDTESHAGFSRDLANLGSRCSSVGHSSINSRQPRLLHETKGAYRGADPRALLADGAYGGYHLNRQYEAEALVTSTFKDSGVLQPHGPRIESYAPPQYYAEPPVTSAPPMKTRGGGPPVVAGHGLSSHAPRRSPSFLTRQPRFTPGRTYRGTDPRAILADDPYTGRHDHMYQATNFERHDPTALTKDEEQILIEAGYLPESEKKKESKLDAKAGGGSSQPLFASAAKMGLADAKGVVKRDEPVEWPPKPAAKFHDTDDRFRYGILIHQPSRPHSSFASGLGRLPGKPKQLEPYHRERMGAELTNQALTGFIARPFAGVGLH